MTLNYSLALDFENIHATTKATIDSLVHFIYLLRRSICGRQNDAICSFGYSPFHRREAKYTQKFLRKMSYHFRKFYACLLKRGETCIEYLSSASLNGATGLNTTRFAFSG